MNSSASLVARDLTKVFFPRTANEVVALNDLSLQIHPGDFITVIGSNGSGKSTFLNTIAGTVSFLGTTRVRGPGQNLSVSGDADGGNIP